MKYETQKVALPFFMVAMALFALQIVFGLLAATVYAWPNFMAELMPFNIMRVSHTNLLIVWLLIGFIHLAFLRAEQFRKDTGIDFFSEDEIRSGWSLASQRASST